MKKQTTHGFTLIELLVVIAIIGILSALIFVGLAKAREKATATKIKSDLNQLYSLAQIHYASNGPSATSNCNIPTIDPNPASPSYTNFDICIGPGSSNCCAGGIENSADQLVTELYTIMQKHSGYGYVGAGVSDSGDNVCINTSAIPGVADPYCRDQKGLFENAGCFFLSGGTVVECRELSY